MEGDRVPGPFNDAVDERERWRRELIKRHLDGKDVTKDLDELILRAQASWIREFGELDDVALATLGAGRGNFLTRYSKAWLAADAWNKRLMRPVWEALIRKYGLAPGTGGSPPAEPGQDP